MELPQLNSTPLAKAVVVVKNKLNHVGFGDMYWIDVAQVTDRWRCCCEWVNEPLGSIKCGEFLDCLGTC